MSDIVLSEYNKYAVGLSNVDNTSDANKPVSTAQQTALNAKRNKLTRVNLANLTIDAATGNDFFCTLASADSFSISNLVVGFPVNIDVLNNTAATIALTYPNVPPWKVDDDLVTGGVPAAFSLHFEIEDDGTNKWFRIGNLNKAKA